MKFIVCEVQHLSNDTVVTSAFAFDDERSASARYHQILSAAAMSGLPVHSAIMFTERGLFLKSEEFTAEPEVPETDPEEV